MLKYLKVEPILSYTVSPDGCAYIIVETRKYDQNNVSSINKVWTVDFRSKSKPNTYTMVNNKQFGYILNRLYNLQLTTEEKQIIQMLPNFSENYKVLDKFNCKKEWIQRIYTLKFMSELIE